jgi:hypothetical protein
MLVQVMARGCSLPRRADKQGALDGGCERYEVAGDEGSF